MSPPIYALLNLPCCPFTIPRQAQPLPLPKGPKGRKGQKAWQGILQLRIKGHRQTIFMSTHD